MIIDDAWVNSQRFIELTYAEGNHSKFLINLDQVQFISKRQDGAAAIAINNLDDLFISVESYEQVYRSLHAQRVVMEH